MNKRELFIGIDFGATWLRVAVADETGEILDKIKFRTPKTGGEIINQLGERIENLLSGKKGELVSIGIGSIGPLNLRERSIANPPNLPVKDLKIVDALSQHFNVPVYLVNDCSAGVLGEKYFGDGKNLDNLFYLTLSTGIGGGAIVDGNLLFGKDGNAPEIGHIIVDSKLKLQCGCGGWGHWEGYASGSNIPRFVKLFVETYGYSTYEESSLYSLSEGDPLKITSKDLYDAAQQGDSFALRIVEELNKIHTIGIAEIVNVFDPELITVGGSIALNNGNLIVPYIEKNVLKLLINRMPKLELTPLGDEIVLYGAIALAMHPEYIPKKFRRFNTNY
ncbi:MAG: ROK family protein [Candidatus Njordarchaeia archaeon]